jgi:hypothetical protein
MRQVSGKGREECLVCCWLPVEEEPEPQDIGNHQPVVRMELKRQDTPHSRAGSTRQGVKTRLQWGKRLGAYHWSLKKRKYPIATAIAWSKINQRSSPQWVPARLSTCLILAIIDG